MVGDSLLFPETEWYKFLEESVFSMRRVESIKQTTQNKFLNMYELDMKSDTGKHSTYFVASRAKTTEELKIKTRQNKADGVIIYSVYRDEKEKKEKLVLIRQYRCPLDDYIYEFPAGLVDEGKTLRWLACGN